MNSNNPLTPQGALEGQRPRVKSNVYIAVFAILAFHVVLLGALLLQGCKERQTTNVAGAENASPLFPTMLSNPPAPPPLTTDLGQNNLLPPPSFSNNTVLVTPLPSPIDFGAPPSNYTIDPALPIVTPPATPGYLEHKVAANESFYSIGLKYGVSMNAIAKANEGVDPKRLTIGQKIKVPDKTAMDSAPAMSAALATPEAAGNLYEVKKGDYLFKIAKDHGTSVEEIKEANNLRTSLIRIGQKLRIPAKAGRAAEATTPVAAPPATSARYTTPLPARGTASL